MAETCVSDACLQRIVTSDEAVQALLQAHFTYLSWVIPLGIGIVLGALSLGLFWKVVGKW